MIGKDWMAHSDESMTAGLQVGALFSCSRLRQGPTESGALWNRVLHNCSSTEAGRLQAATRRAGIAAATRALHYHIGIEVMIAAVVVAVTTSIFTLSIVIFCEEKNVLVRVRF